MTPGNIFLRVVVEPLVVVSVLRRWEGGGNIIARMALIIKTQTEPIKMQQIFLIEYFHYFFLYSFKTEDY